MAEKKNSAVIEAAYHYSNPADFKIRDVFYILSSGLLDNRYLEKASLELRLQASLLLLNNDLPLPPARIIELAGMKKDDTSFKVNDQESWDELFEVLGMLQISSDTGLLDKIPEKEERAALQKQLENLSEKSDLPFSEKNISYCFRKLALDFSNAKLRESEIYKQLQEYREFADHLLDLLKDPDSACCVQDSADLTLFSALTTGNLFAFKRILAEKKEDPEQLIGRQPLISYALNHLLVNNDLRFFNALAAEIDQLPASVAGKSLISLLLLFDAKKRDFKKACNICLEKGVVLTFDQWQKLLDEENLAKMEEPLKFFADSQSKRIFSQMITSETPEETVAEEEEEEETENSSDDDIDFEALLDAFGDDDDDVVEEKKEEKADDDLTGSFFENDDDGSPFGTFIQFIRKAVEKGGPAANVAAAFINSELQKLNRSQIRRLLAVLHPASPEKLSLPLFFSLISSGLLDKEIEDLCCEKIARCLLSLEGRWRKVDQEETPEFYFWLTQIKSVLSADVFSDVLFVFSSRYKITDNGRSDIRNVLEVLTEAEKDDFLISFSSQLFSNAQNLDDGWSRSFEDAVNDALQKLSFRYVDLLIRKGIVDRLILDDYTVAHCIPDMEDENEFAALVKDNRSIGCECLDAAAASGRRDILGYMLDVLEIPLESSGSDILSRATQYGQADLLHYVLNRYPDMIYERDHRGLLPIHRAVKERSSKDVPFDKVKECLILLCGNGMELLDAVSPEGSPLAVSAAGRDEKIFKFLLEKNADVNAHCLVKGGGAIVHACREEYIRLLLEKDADVNAADGEGNTVFNTFNFSDTESLELFEKLLKKADPAVVIRPNCEGRNVLHCLCEEANQFTSDDELKAFLKILRKLVKTYHADLNGISLGCFSQKTPFMHAAASGNLPVLKELIKLGAEPFAVGCDGKNALFSVLESWTAEKEVIKFLVEKIKLPVNTIDSEGQNILWYTVDSGSDKKECFDYLVQHGADVHRRDNQGKNLLWKVLDAKNYELFEELLTGYKLDAGTVIDDGTLLFKLVDQIRNDDDFSLDRFKELCEVCLKQNVPVNAADSCGRHVIQYAVSCAGARTTEVLKILLQLPGIKCPETDDEGNTLLHLAAAERDAVQVAEFLIKELQFEVSVKNNNGDWPLHLAAANGDAAMCKVLGEKNPGGFRQLNNDGKSPLYHLIRRHAEKLDLIKKFVDEYDSDINWSSGKKKNLLDVYLDQRNSSIEGMDFFIRQGLRCQKFDWVAEKEIDFVKDYVSKACGNHADILISEIGASVLPRVIRNGKIDTLKYLANHGLYIWSRFRNDRFLHEFRINEHTASWLRLFFIEWQWSRRLLAKKEEGPYIIDNLISDFDSSVLPALAVLLDELKRTSSAQKIFDRIAEERQDKLSDEEVLTFFIKHGVDPSLSVPAVFSLLKYHENQELFADILDRVADNVQNENICIEVFDHDTEITTTLLHAAAGNSENIFALRYLIEKCGLSVDGTKDSRGLTILEYAASCRSTKAVHYLLSRFNFSAAEINRALLEAVKSDEWENDVCYLLCEVYKADVTYKDNFGRTVLDYVSDDDLQRYFERKTAEKR